MKPNWHSLTDYLEASYLKIDIERTASIAERELEHLIEVGAYQEIEGIVRRVCTLAGARLYLKAEAAE